MRHVLSCKKLANPSQYRRRVAVGIPSFYRAFQPKNLIIVYDEVSRLPHIETKFLIDFTLILLKVAKFTLNFTNLSVFVIILHSKVVF